MNVILIVVLVGCAILSCYAAITATKKSNKIMWGIITIGWIFSLLYNLYHG